jgi:myotubularin-related protein 3/4
VLARSSQPTVGWLGWRNTQDEAMLKAIADSCGLIPDFSNGDLNCIESSIITGVCSVS